MFLDAGIISVPYAFSLQYIEVYIKNRRGTTKKCRFVKNGIFRAFPSVPGVMFPLFRLQQAA
ncbi:MAG: hypothetical protein BHW56_06715 [Acetobacter sp. 46_36]|nr:MAG: hypothetical protein BHW56_06715 [Acetobacter sp. 46_36]